MKARLAVPVFQVADLAASLQHYTGVLGFTEDFRFGQYAGIRLSDACLHLCAHTFHDRTVGAGMATIFCDEVDQYYSEIKSRGATMKGEPDDREYAMRDFVTIDPDGNHLTFGCESKAA